MREREGGRVDEKRGGENVSDLLEVRYDVSSKNK